jgi:hypothetical protein
MVWISGTPTDLRQGLTRRDWLRVGLAGGLAALGHQASRQPAVSGMATAAGRGFGRAKSCILIYLFGGVSQLDVWDLKPSAPEGIRGEFQPRQTSVPGIQVTEHLPRLAHHVDKLLIVRSMSHGDNNHGSSAHRMLTGHAPRQTGEVVPPSPEDFPHYGSVLTQVRPAAKGMPTFVSLPWTVATSSSVQPGQGGGFLGRRCDPLRLEQALPDVIDFTPDGLRLAGEMSPERLQGRQALRQRFASTDRLAGGPAGRDMDAFYERAFALLGAAHAVEAFDLTRESPKLRERYGMNTFGQSLLLARRLAERGVPLITVYWPPRREPEAFNNAGRLEDVAVPPWDTHGRNVGNSPNFPMLKDRLLPALDQSSTALLEDLAARGRLEETLVVWTTEFGRTPKINPQAGRDHWGKVFSIALAGAGIEGGQVYGASDRLGAEPADKPVSPSDWAATLFHALGVSPTTEILDPLARPHRIADGQPLIAWWG